MKRNDAEEKNMPMRRKHKTLEMRRKKRFGVTGTQKNARKTCIICTGKIELQSEKHAQAHKTYTCAETELQNFPKRVIKRREEGKL